MKRLIKKKKNFTMISNKCLQTNVISNGARGLLTFMLSLPNDWQFSIAWLAKNCRDGKSAIRSQIAELEDTHYLVRVQSKHHSGRFGCSNYIISDEPMTDEAIEEILAEHNGNASDFTSSENKTSEKWTSANETTTNIIDTNKINKNTISVYQEEEKADMLDKIEEPISQEAVKEQIEYDRLMREKSALSEQTDDLVGIIAETLNSKNPVCISGCKVSHKEIVDKFSQLNYRHIVSALEALNKRQRRSKLNNPKAYIRSMLYNMVDEDRINSAFDNAVPVEDHGYGLCEDNISSFDIEDLKSLANKFI